MVRFGQQSGNRWPISPLVSPAGQGGGDGNPQRGLRTRKDRARDTCHDGFLQHVLCGLNQNLKVCVSIGDSESVRMEGLNNGAAG